MGVRKRLASVIEKLERDAAERFIQADEAADRARSVEVLSEEIVMAIARETNSPAIVKPAGRACAAVFGRWNTRANLLVGSSGSLQGAANENRAALAGRGISGSMDRQRYELLGKHGPAAIAAAKRHRVSVDAMMLSLAPLLKEVGEMKGEEVPELDTPERIAAAELYDVAPELADVPWPKPLPEHSAEEAAEAHAEAERTRVAEKLKARKIERERLAKAAELAKTSAPKRPSKKRAAAK